MSIRLIKSGLVLITVLASIIANADQAFFNKEAAYTRATVDAGIIIDSPVGFQTWKNGYAQTSIKYDTTSDAGMFLWGSTLASLDTISDDNIQAIEGIRAFLFITGKNTEITVGGDDGTFILSPQVETDSLTGIKQGHYIWEYSVDNYKINVDFKVRSIRNHLQWKYEIINKSTASFTAALRVIENIKFPVNNNVTERKNERPFILSSGELVTTESVYNSSTIPSNWHIIYPGDASLYTSEPYFKLTQDFSFLKDDKYLVKPEMLIFGDTGRLIDNTWIYSQNSQTLTTAKTMSLGTNLGTDSAVGLYFNKFTLSTSIPNKIFAGNLMMGVDSSVAAKDSLGAIKSDSISIKKIANLPTATSDIPVVVTVANASVKSDSIVSLMITTGSGLSIQNGTNATINNIIVETESNKIVTTNNQDYTWKLKSNGTVTGLIPIKVRATFSSGTTAEVTIYVNIPATTTLNKQPGLYLVGFPYQFTNNSVSAVLGTSNNIALAKYDVTLKKHIKSNEGNDFSINPGVGYWLKVISPTSINLPGATPLSYSNDYANVVLSPGWNLISSPFIYGVKLGDCKINFDGNVYTFKNAIASGLINSAVYSYNSDAGIYSSNYYFDDDLYNLSIQPYTGYWIYSYKNANFSFSALTNFRSSENNNRNVNGWISSINVVADNGLISTATIGVASDNNLMRNIIAPPSIPDAAEIVINSAGDKLSRQINYPSTQSVWQFNINPSPKRGILSIKWGSQQEFPGNYALTLIDKETGKRVNMRTTSVYTYNSTDSSRQFEIIAEKRTAKLSFSNATVNVLNRRSQRIISINYQLTAPANVSMNIRSITGKNIAAVSGTSDTTTGVLIWNSSETTGKNIQSGVYLVELTAQDAEGTKVKSNIPVNIK